MKKVNALYIFLFLVQFCYSQKDKNFYLDKEFFLLGTLSEDMGRYKDPMKNELVDYYYIPEKSILLYNYNLFKEDYQDLKLDTIDRVLISKNLTEKINTFYTWKYDEYPTNKNLDSLFIGEINSKKIKTKLQKISFVTGIYSRFGEKNDTTYCIRLFNAETKSQKCVEILKKLKCKNIQTKIIEAIPTNFIIYFTPTEEVKKYLNNYYFLWEERLRLLKNSNSG